MKKIYLCINKKQINGYEHYDPMPKDDIPAFTGKLSDIDCELSECDELLAPEILDTIPYQNIDDVLKFFTSLLRHKGKIILGGTEITELSRELLIGYIADEDYNKIVFGKFPNRGIYDINKIKDKLIKLGLVIDKIRIDGVKMLIEAIRP